MASSTRSSKDMTTHSANSPSLGAKDDTGSLADPNRLSGPPPTADPVSKRISKDTLVHTMTTPSTPKKTKDATGLLPDPNRLSVPPPTADPVSKRFSKDSASTAVHTIEPLHLEEGQPRPILSRFRFKSRSIKLKTNMKKYLATLLKSTSAILGIIAIVVLFLLLDVLYVIFAYYLSYAEIYFNSKVAYHIFRNSHTEGAFKFFFWLISLLACIPNLAIAYGVAWVGVKMGKAVNLPACIFLFWMIPFGGAFLGLKSITFWIRPIVKDAYQANIFNKGCAANGWDLDIVFSSSDTNTLTETLPIIGTANISSTHSSSQYEFTRHSDNHARIDFVLTDSTTHPPFTNITYDWQNHTYTALGPNSTNVTGTFITTPNLSFPSLNLSLLDDSIPFERPDYSACWPAAATLVMRNSSSTSDYVKVLKSLTLDPSHSSRMKVCGMAMSEAFQISLGVVFIEHYRYSLCVTKPNVQSPTGSESDPEYWNDDSSR